MTGPNTIGASGLTRDGRLDVVVIAAGQAGLAVAWHLARWGMRFVVLEAADQLGSSWRGRWDSLRLFSPAQYDALPGMAFPAPADTYPGKEAVADFLRDYATRFDLPVRLSKRVTGLSRIGDESKFAQTTRYSARSRYSWPPGRSRVPSPRRLVTASTAQ